MDRGWAISRGCFGSSRLVVVHLEDVLLEVSDPVLLHRQRTVKLHLAEPDGETEHTHSEAGNYADEHGQLPTSTAARKSLHTEQENTNWWR